MSKSHNLDMLFSVSCNDATLDLFLKLLDAYPIPKLSEIKVRNSEAITGIKHGLLKIEYCSIWLVSLL